MSPDAYTRRKLLTAPVFLLVCFVVLEIAVRLISHADADGNRWFEGLRLKPYGLPVQRIAGLIHGYQAARAGPTLAYDPDLGWVPGPDRGSSSPRDLAWATAPGASPRGTRRVRIAVFGASYTAGWWQSLQDSLSAAGVPAVVVSFGCGGYGMDQALLRWRKEGASFRPDIVLFGFTRQDCENNLNLFRLFAEPETGIPFLKPRFVLSHDRLEVINVPTPPLEEVPGVVARFGLWPLAASEGYFQPGDYRMPLWRRSVLLSLLEARFTAARDRRALAQRFGEHGEGAELALRIVRQFRQEAEAVGSRFYVVHLPHEDDLRSYQETGASPASGLLAGVSRIAPVVRPEAAMLESARGQDLSRYFAHGHYTKEFNSVIARTLARALLASPDSALFRRVARPG